MVPRGQIYSCHFLKICSVIKLSTIYENRIVIDKPILKNNVYDFKNDSNITLRQIVSYD